MGLVVGQYIDSFFPAIDGVINVVSNYAKILNGRYGVCCVVAPDSPGYMDDEPFEVMRVRSARVTNRRSQYRAGMPALDAMYRRRIKNIKFDIVHAHSPFGCGLEARRLATERGIPLVATFHSKYYEDFKQATNSEKIAEIGAKYVGRYFSHADYVWTVNESTAGTLREYGYGGRICVVPNGVDMAMRLNADELAAASAGRYRLGAGNIFLFVGQIIWQKNVKLIAEALALYSRLNGDFTMVFVGEGDARPRLEGLCRELGLAGRVIFTGAIRDRMELQSLYLAADLLLFPSVYDNAPLVVREAAAMELPSVLVEGSNAAEGVADGVNGYLCAQTAASLSGKIAQAVRDKEGLGRVGRGAAQTLPVSWDQIVERVHALYIETIEDFKKEARPIHQPRAMREASALSRGGEPASAATWRRLDG